MYATTITRCSQMNTSHLKYWLLKEIKIPNFWQKMTENISAKKFGDCVWHFTNEHFARMTENFCFRSSSIFFDLTPNKKVDHFSERHVFLRERRTLVSWARFKRFFAPKNVAFWNFAKWKSTRSKLKLYLFFYITQPTQPSPFLWPFNFFLKAQTINKRLHWKGRHKNERKASLKKAECTWSQTWTSKSSTYWANTWQRTLPT